VLNAEFPAVAVRVMKPNAHVLGTWRLRSDFVTGIFDLDLVLLQMRQRFSQGQHVGQMKRHVVQGLWHRFPFE